MANVLVVEHSLAWLPTKGSKVLDVGCRCYDFASYLAELECEVLVIEPDDLVSPSSHKNITTLQAALVPESQAGTLQNLIKFGNGSANHLENVVGTIPKDYTCQATKGMSISQICKYAEVDVWDVVKLDCEGSEYGVLLEWPGPVAKQITVEFHEHTGANTFGLSVYNYIFKHLSKWYKVVQHELSIRHCLSIPNYWDTLLVLQSSDWSEK